MVRFVYLLFEKVPFGGFGFMPGQIYHTNEVMVLLGDNWFAKRTVKQAMEMIGRRIHCVFVVWCSHFVS